jgi:hypothetical protein
VSGARDEWVALADRVAAIDPASYYDACDELAAVEADIRALAARLPVGGEPVAWRIIDGEGGYHLHENAPGANEIEWASRYGRKFEPLYAAPPPSAEPRP